jgi:hypothetical protein
VYALLQLLVCLPLHLTWAGPRGGRTAHEEAGGSPAAPPANPASASPSPGRADGTGSMPADSAWRERAIALLAAVLAANALVFASLSAHLITVLQGLGLAAATAVAISSLKGIAQVAARLLELGAQRWLGPIAVGVIATAMLPLALVLLELVPPLAVPVALCCVIYGASNGLLTIVRGAVPLALFGHQGYGTVLGRLAAPGLIAAALAPAVFAWILERYGVRAGLGALTVASIASFAGMVILARSSAQNLSARNT